MLRKLCALTLVFIGGNVVQLVGAPDELAARVILLANSRQPESVKLAEFYAAQRGVPVANIVALPMPEEETITWRQFIDQVYQPVQDELYRRGWFEGTASALLDRFGRKRYALTENHISYLVVCRGVPLRVYNDPTLLDPTKANKAQPIPYKNEGAVDAELSLLALGGYEIGGMIGNPLYVNNGPVTMDTAMVVKVSRLDGPSFADARHLVESALLAEQQGVIGRYYIDTHGGPDPTGDRWLEATRALLKDLGFDGDSDESPTTFGAGARFDAPVFYFGWYSGGFGGPMALPGFRFPPGAVALHIHSFSAQTLHSSTQAWCGPLIAHGVTATVGNVFEPYLGLTHRPHLLMRALVQGKNWGDAVYYSLMALSWEGVAIGDPLYRPFKVSVDKQRGVANLSPPSLAAYLTLRCANLLRDNGHAAEVAPFLKEAFRAQPSLPLGLALAKVAMADKQPAEVVRALGFVPLLKKFGLSDWPLAREAAALLAANEAAPAALQVYLTLVGQPAPSPDDFKALLQEAKRVADVAGDLKRSLYFGNLLTEQTTVKP